MWTEINFQVSDKESKILAENQHLVEQIHSQKSREIKTQINSMETEIAIRETSIEKHKNTLFQLVKIFNPLVSYIDFAFSLTSALKANTSLSNGLLQKYNILMARGVMKNAIYKNLQVSCHLYESFCLNIGLFNTNRSRVLSDGYDELSRKDDEHKIQQMQRT